jgi:hypothetical protein
VLIWLVCLTGIFVIGVLGQLLCPRQDIYTMGELQDHGFLAKNPFVAIRGEVFDLGRIAKGVLLHTFSSLAQLSQSTNPQSSRSNRS